MENMQLKKSLLLDIFNINKKIQFYIFHFHDYFDQLIGFETLRDFDAYFDVGKNMLKIGKKEYQLKKKYPDYQTINNTDEVHFIKIETKSKNDLVVGEETGCGPYYILPGIYSSDGTSALVAVKNNNNIDPQTNFNELHLHEEEFVETEGPSELSEKKFKVIDNYLSQQEQKALQYLIDEHTEIIHFENEKLTFTHAIKHNIRTIDNIPIHTKSYRYPQIFESEVQNQVKKMLKDGIVRESISPYTSPVWIVPKKADATGLKKDRLVVDYRKLNNNTISNKYPIPDITDILDKLGRASYFSTIDLVSGFHQIQMEDKDIEKTAFSIKSGKFEFTRMPFGLKNAPATFQRVMDAILREFIGICCLVYMDDIIIFSSSLEDHVKDIRKIFQKLKDARLKIQIEKCYFFRREVQFLGHTVSEDGVRPNSDKIEIIKTWPVPKTEKELKQFLGTIGYYRRFIRDFAKMIKPLTQLLRKESEFQFTSKEIACFEKCKSLLTMDPILAYPDYTKEFILTTDASNFAVGAVLSQGQIGKDRPIAYASRTLNKSEENYCTTEKELLAIVWAVKQFRQYLYGRKFKLVTDHRPLIYASSSLNQKIVRWNLVLTEFDFETIYRPGKENVVADALSRIRPNFASNEIGVNELNGETNDEMTIHSADTSDDHYIRITEKPTRKVCRMRKKKGKVRQYRYA